MNNNLIKIYDEIKEKPWNYSLHQVMFIIENLKKNEFASSNYDPAALNANVNFWANTSDVIKHNEKNNQINLTLNAASLIGINGLLPQAYTEKILSRIKTKDYRMIDFLNIFHQRSFGLIHKTEKYNKIHLKINDHKHLTQEFCKSSENFKEFKQLLWKKNKNKFGFLQILKNLFKNQKIDFKIKEFILKKVKIDDENKTFLNNEKLTNKLLGNHVLTIDKKIKLIIETKFLKDYETFLPNQINFNKIKKIFKYYTNNFYEIEIKPILIAEKEKISFLKKEKKLGLNVWLV